MITAGFFKPQEHDPAPFLGQTTALPELHEYTEPLRALLGEPVLSMERAHTWMQHLGVSFFISGYDEKLAKEHWGVIPARMLEVLFFRMADMASDTPRWGMKVPDNTQEITIYCESMNRHDLLRDLTVFVDNEPLAPPAAPEKEYLIPTYEGNARIEALFSPMPVSHVIVALAAWDALRFSDHKDAQGRPRRFRLDVQTLREKGALMAMQTLFGEDFGAQAQAQLLDGHTSEASCVRLGARL